MSDRNPDDMGRYSRSPGYRGRDKGGDRFGSPNRRAPPPPPEGDEDFTQLYVNGLPRNVSQERVMSHFSRIGEVENLSIKQKYAFIKYVKHDDAVCAISELHNSILDGYKLVVERSYPAGGARRKRTTGP